MAPYLPALRATDERARSFLAVIGGRRQNLAAANA
jgi:hypothetical protein